MKVKLGLSLVLVALSFIVMSYNMPEGWFKAGSSPDKYEMGTDPGAGERGANAATIKSKEGNVTGFGTLMQNVSAENYRGKRVRLSGVIKTKDVVGWSGLWLRVDGKDPKKPLAFDNMYDRPVKGTTGWIKCKIVLDVPKDAINIAYGGLLDGGGQMWFSSLKFEVVANTVHTTDKEVTNQSPTNLNFRK